MCMKMVDVVNVQNNEQNYVFLVKIVNIMKQFTNKEQTQRLIKLGFQDLVQSPTLKKLSTIREQHSFTTMIIPSVN